jgi:glycosyltransferase involved in cell wall biosynthesis
MTQAKPAKSIPAQSRSTEPASAQSRSTESASTWSAFTPSAPGEGPSRRPIRVLHVITGLAAGGAEDQLRLLLPRLRGHGVEAEAAVFYNAGSVAEALRADGIPVTDLDSPGFWDWRGTARLTKLIRTGGYDLVHTHLFRAGLHGRLAARRGGVRTLVHTEHSLNPVLIEGRRRSGAIDRLYRWAERRGTLTVAVSAAVAEQLSGLGVGPERIRVLPNGLDRARLAFDPEQRAAFRAEHGLAETDFVVLCLGRLAASKRIELVIDALARFENARPENIQSGDARSGDARSGDIRPVNLRLLVVGDGEERAALEAQAALRLPGRAVFTGELPGARLPAALAAADLLLSPSPEETFGLAVLEAVAAGLPVAFASCPALTELNQAVPGLDESGLGGPGLDAPGLDRPDQDEPGQLEPKGPGLTSIHRAAIRRISGTAGSLELALGRAVHARAGAEPGGRTVDPGVAEALRGYDIESIVDRMAQLYRELLGLSADGPTAPDTCQISQERRVGVHHV